MKDENGATIANTDLTTFTLTLYNKDTGAIINSRDAQNVLNANNVTVDGAGAVAWTMQPADSPIINDDLNWEDHVALFKLTWTGGKQTNHEAIIRVQNVSKVP